MADRTERLGAAAHRALRELAREILGRRPGGHLVEAGLKRLDLELPLVLRGDGADAATFTRALREAVERRVDDAVQHAAAFRPGHAYCLRCGQSACAHAAPPSSRHVFAGYSQTGLPDWIELGQLCLARRHPDVDRLYDARPAFVTLVQAPAELRAGLIEAFDAGRVELLGQVVAGFFSVPAAAHEGRGIVALTVQAAVSRGNGGRPRLGLNVIGRAPGGEGLDAVWERLGEAPWHRAVRWAQGALSTCRTPRAERVQGILHGLARRLEHDRRSRARRTAHAEERHAEGGRPTRKAVEDARAARGAAVLVDRRSGAVVVLGERGRTHFFSREGQLVSSVRYSREAIERKIRLELWRPAEPEERAALSALLRGDRPA